MKILLGTKKYMTQVFDESGKVKPVTIVSVAPLIVTAKQSYKRQSKAEMVQIGTDKTRREFPAIGNLAELAVGTTLAVDLFADGDEVAVSGITKGKGFQGVVKRHRFSGGPRSHGQKHSEREAGSIGATGPQRVFKGVRMPGRMGGDRITIKRLKIIKVDKDNNLLYIGGAIPGRQGTLLEIKGI
ncbi:MAG: 50S ribosomal protein L3 [Candidatus Vogelbacteria bacterium]|nr:50S ribosomal protein L3 [Candidatus Vogelbacteria bacterium]